MGISFVQNIIIIALVRKCFSQVRVYSGGRGKPQPLVPGPFTGGGGVPLSGPSTGVLLLPSQDQDRGTPSPIKDQDRGTPLPGPGWGTPSPLPAQPGPGQGTPSPFQPGPGPPPPSPLGRTGMGYPFLLPPKPGPGQGTPQPPPPPPPHRQDTRHGQDPVRAVCLLRFQARGLSCF